MLSLAALVVQAKQTPEQAERQLLPVLRAIFPGLGIETVAINTGSEVSLNSVNGILTAKNGRRLFFKFHAEEGETQSLAGGEYYRAELLGKAGWDVISPIAVSTKAGQQCLVYEECRDPTAYDVFGAQDDLYLRARGYDDDTVKNLLAAEEKYVRKTVAIMTQTLQPASPETATAPLLQLFSHRLHGTGGATPRLDLFYTHKPVTLPDGTSAVFEDIASRTWIVNGRAMLHTLAEIIAFSKTCLAVDNLTRQATVISHGDDHNGNKFLIGGGFVTFDPAFAGRHPALLAPMKGAMHNAPLHPFWYYKPGHVHDAIELSCAMTPDRIEIKHNAADVLASPLREHVFRLHIDNVFRPLLKELARKNLLPEDWRMVLRCAAFCCPFLAVNMIDIARLPGKPQFSLFNLSKCVEAFHMPVWDELAP